MALGGLPTYPSFDVKGENLAVSWKKWSDRLDLFFVGYNITAAAQKRALLLTFAGEGLCDLVDSMPDTKFTVTEADTAAGLDIYTKTVKVLTEHFSPIINKELQKYKFHESKQTQDTVQEYYEYLSTLADTCGFADKDAEIKSKIISGCKSHKLKMKGLHNPNMTLLELLDHARAYEITERSARAMLEVDSVKVHKKDSCKKPYTQSHNDQKKDICEYCGYRHRVPGKCPAKGQECRLCHKLNHFESVCRSASKSKKGKKKSQRVQSVEVDDTSLDNDFYLGSVDNANDSPWMTVVEIKKKKLNFKIDTGADVSVVSHQTFKMLQPRPRLESTTASLRSPGGKLDCLGYFETEVQTDKGKGKLKIFVLEGNTENLLSREAATRFGFVQRVDEIFGDTPSSVKCKPVKILLTPNAEPYVQTAARRIPIPQLPKVEEELKRMEKAGVIERITEPTEWCAPIVPVAKPNGKVRICTDFKRLNTAVKRERYILPTLEDIVHKLHGSTVFSKLDATAGYWQIPLDPETAKLTTFITPFGRFFYRRLPFGISSASEIFQRTMEDILGDIDGVECFQDDVLVHSKTAQEHEALKKRVFDRVKSAGLTLNKSKCEFDRSEITFLGHIIDGNGLRPDPSRIQAIQDFQAPTDVSKLRSFLGMINYVGRFIPNLSDIVRPLNQLLCQDVAWTWGPAQRASFTKVKDLVANSTTLAFFQVDKPTIISADASSYGLGAVLLQETEGEWRPIAYASRSLTAAERGYAQIEKECLASVWSCEKFQRYLVGLPHFKVLTDHKPLISLINKKDIQDTPIRCQRMLMRLMRFNVTAEFVPGKEMVVADALSREPAVDDDSEHIDSITQQVRVQVEEMKATWPASDQKLEELKEATRRDIQLPYVIQHTMQGWPANRQDVILAARDFYDVRQELSIYDGLLLRGHRIVIPYEHRKQTLETIHQGHLGINKCRERAGQAVWWPGIGKEIEATVSSCQICLSKRPSQHAEPLISTPLPERPFQKVAADLFEFEKKEYLIFVDYYSRFIEIASMGNITSETTINRLKNIFARYGVPASLMTDNGTQFTSASFEKFSKTWNFAHDTSSPHFHQANGAAERAVRTAKHILSQEDPQLALLTYRSTPIPELGASPAELAFGRRIRTTLPILPSQLDSPVISRQEFRRKDREYKSKQKLNHDRHKGAKPLKPLKPGDPVMMKLDGEKRWTRPGRVRMVHSPRSYIVEADDGGCVRRNRKHLQSRPDSPEAGRGSLGPARIGVGPKPSPVYEAARPADGPNMGIANSHSGDGRDGILTEPPRNIAARQGVGPNGDVYAAARQGVGPNGGVIEAARQPVVPNGDDFAAARPGVEPNEGLLDLPEDPPDIVSQEHSEILPRRSERGRKPKEYKDYITY